MKTQVILSLLFAVFMSPSFLLAQDSSSDRYCNNRYSFCVNYPSQIFTEMHLASNGDGIILHTKKEDIIVRANGNYNVMNWTIEEELENFLQIMNERSAGSMKQLRKEVNNGSFEILLESGGALLYKRCILSQDHFISFSIELNRLGITSSYTINQLLELLRLDLGDS